MNSLSIIICTHNRERELDSVLQSLEKLTMPPEVATELLVILNGCDDDSESVIQRRAKHLPLPVRIIDEPNLGLSHARNRGLREARGDVIAFLDDDVRVSPGWLMAFKKSFETMEVHIIGGRTLLWWRDNSPPVWWSRHFTWILSGFDHGGEDFIFQRACAVGANFAIRREVYEVIGGFDLKLGRKGQMLTAGEESDFLRRADVAGFRGGYSADALVEHLVPLMRVNVDYFTKVARGYGEAYYVINVRKGWRRLASICQQAMLWSKYILLSVACKKNSSAHMLALIKRNSAVGALYVLMRNRLD